jgi:sec-independent protein translocase protein TatC
VKIGLVGWPFAALGGVVAIFTVCAVLTPPDPFTQSILAIPMCGLYVLGLVLARAAAARRMKQRPGHRPVPRRR